MAEGDKYTDLLGVRKVALGLPNSADQAGYNGLDWAVLKGVVNWPDQGDEYTDASEATLDTGRTEHRAGAVDGGVIDFPSPSSRRIPDRQSCWPISATTR